MARRALVTVVLTVALCSAGVAYAQVPRLISFQGRLANASGVVRANGSFSVQFGIFTVASGGTACFTETQTVTTDVNGRFVVNIGGITSGGIATGCTFTATNYLQLKVGADLAMTPRLALNSAPYAIRAAKALNADSISGVAAAQLGTKALYSYHASCLGASSLGNQTTYNPNFAPANGVLTTATSCFAYTYSGQTGGGCGEAAPACPAGCTDLGATCEGAGYSHQASATCVSSCAGCTVNTTGTTYYRQKRSCSCSNDFYGYAR